MGEDGGDNERERERERERASARVCVCVWVGGWVGGCLCLCELRIWAQEYSLHCQAARILSLLTGDFPSVFSSYPPEEESKEPLA